MHPFPSPRLPRALATTLALATSLLACSSSSPAPGTIHVTPADQDVLTCSRLQLAQTGGAGGGAWSVSPGSGSGTIDATGLYSAPLARPAVADATITYAEASASASATLHLATAFLGARGTLPIAGNPHALADAVPFEHLYSARGARVYAAVGGSPGLETPVEADVFRSDDGGATFAAPVVYHTGHLLCQTVAVDAGDPDVVYLAYYAGHGDSTSNTGATVRLAVSEDGGKSFPHEYVVADSDDSMPSLICPDVSSPSADHVIVAGVVTPSDSHNHVGTFVSASRGKDLGPVGVLGTRTPANADPTSAYSVTDTNAATDTACPIPADGNGYGPRVFGNGKGTTCLTYAYSGDEFSACAAQAHALFVQCSQDAGATWSAPKVVATSNAAAKNYLTGAISASGKVALTWLEKVGDADEVMIAISTDGGVTFGAKSQYPSRTALGGTYTEKPTVAWQGDVLWLSQTFDASDANFVGIDKSCDLGVTWSGAVNAGKYEGSTLLETSQGMVVTGWERGGQNLAIVPLESLAP